MREVKLFFDSSNLDQVQANLQRVMNDLDKFLRTQQNLNNQIDRSYEAVYEKIKHEIRLMLKHEVYRAFESAKKKKKVTKK